MRFWDASALAGFCVDEPRSARLLELLQADSDLVVWWGTRTECMSALSRLVRNGLDPQSQTRIRSKLAFLQVAWREVAPEETLRAMADRLLFMHPLRAADAFQLAAALQWCGNAPSGGGFVTLDRRLAEAARKEGFSVLP